MRYVFGLVSILRRQLFKEAVTLRVALLIVFIMGLIGFLRTLSLADQYYLMNSKSQDWQLRQIIRVAELDLQSSDIPDLLIRFQSSYADKKINFYSIRSKDKVLDESLSGQTIQLKTDLESGSIVTDENGLYRYGYVGNEQLQIYAGQITNANTFGKVLAYEDFAILELFLYGVAVFGVAAYFLNDFRRLARLLSSASSEGEGLRSTRTIKSGILASGIQNFQSVISRLSETNRQFECQITPAIRHEFWSGHQLPYAANYLLVRTDVNGFTKMAVGEKEELLSQRRHEFFEAVDLVVERYDGLIFQYIGDEVIFYFDAGDLRLAYLRALCAIRDIHSFVDHLNEINYDESNFKFYLKTSLFDSKIRFEKDNKERVHLKGSSLMTTQRALEFVEEKDRHTILFEEKAKTIMGDLIQSEPLGGTNFDGMESIQDVHLFELRQLKPIADLLQNVSVDDVKVLSCYRSDTDITLVLDTVLNKINNSRSIIKDEAFIIAVLKKYSELHLQRAVPSIESTLAKVITTLWLLANNTQDRTPSQFEQKQSEAFLRVLATAIVAVQGLILPNRFEGDIRVALEKCREARNPRVAANLMETFKHFGQNLKPSIDHHRTEAVGLIVLSDQISGNDEWIYRCGLRLKKLLESTNGLRVASGLFALGQINLDRKRKSEVAWSSNTYLEELVKQIPYFTLNASEYVRRQARIAAWKAGLVYELRDIVEDRRLNPSYRQELALFLKEKNHIDQKILDELSLVSSL